MPKPKPLKQLPVNSQVRKACPTCGPAVLLIVKTNSINGSQFLGCPNFPKCRYSEEIPESIRLELSGYCKLPGFE